MKHLRVLTTSAPLLALFLVQSALGSDASPCAESARKALSRLDWKSPVKLSIAKVEKAWPAPLNHSESLTLTASSPCEVTFRFVAPKSGESYLNVFNLTIPASSQAEATRVADALFKVVLVGKALPGSFQEPWRPATPSGVERGECRAIETDIRCVHSLVSNEPSGWQAFLEWVGSPE